jgi:hypothetical protein
MACQGGLSELGGLTDLMCSARRFPGLCLFIMCLGRTDLLRVGLSFGTDSRRSTCNMFHKSSFLDDRGPRAEVARGQLQGGEDKGEDVRALARA